MHKGSVITNIETNTQGSTKSTNHNKREISWPLVLYYIHLNILGLYGFFVAVCCAKLLTVTFTFILTVLGTLGATVGAHRLWAHKTYKASTALRIFLMVCQTLTGQGSIYSWVQGHRLHHQFFKRKEDPYHSAKNFIAAQIYAPILKYTPEQSRLLRAVDMSDLEEDNIVMFQKKFYWFLVLLVNVLLPINAPLEYWGDSVSNAILIAFSLRLLIVWNISCLINSAHFVWGLDKDFKASDSNSVFFLTKNFWPQYHYLLPQDYQSDEFGDYGRGFTTVMIRVFAALGLAKELKTITSTAVRKGLTSAMDYNRPSVECIIKEAEKELEGVTKNLFLNREKFL